MTKQFINSMFFILLLVGTGNAFAQLSPGDLTNAHKHLEGLSNCTKCHVLGEEETTSKCLECHKEIKQFIDSNKGYHASSEVKGKKCAECHGEHFGRNFEIIRFDEDAFKHEITGYVLEGNHNTLKCAECHKTELIVNPVSQKKRQTYLGLGSECLSCHNDFHQNTLSENCISCHNQDKFRPATLFDHSKTKFALIGKHGKVSCEKCHKIESRNEKEFQEFAGVEFSNCTSCHEDVHNNKFGNDCRKCHSEFSFHEVKMLNNFNHDKTNFPLEGKHVFVDCKKCHAGSYTKALKHKSCTDCHKDYHEKQFAKNGNSPDCKECHSVKGFTTSFFGIEKHNQLNFALEGAHMATPCIECHKKNEKWDFKNMGNHCVDCHNNIHENYMETKYIPENNCHVCHTTEQWTGINFDHNKTDFKLEGKHRDVTCRKCHFEDLENNKFEQKFKSLTGLCSDCHNDKHNNQFVENGVTNCLNCHTNNNWEPDKFNHDQARFKLDGKHEGLACVKCHKPDDTVLNSYIVYKFEDITCASCH